MEFVISLVIAAGLGLIPANIAKKKGYSFGLWWFYGWMLFIVAIIHVQFIPDKNAPQEQSAANRIPAGQSGADELRKFKELYDQGVLTKQEFEEKKKRLLGL